MPHAAALLVWRTAAGSRTARFPKFVAVKGPVALVSIHARQT